MIKKYDDNENIIYFKSSSGYESWWEYDEHNRTTHYKESNGTEAWWEYDRYNCRIEITRQKIKEKEFLNRKKVSRFEVMDL